MDFKGCTSNIKQGMMSLGHGMFVTAYYQSGSPMHLSLLSPVSKGPSSKQLRNPNNTRTHSLLEGSHPVELIVFSPPKLLILMNGSGSLLQVNLCERSHILHWLW